MKHPSLTYLGRHTLDTLRRFPWVLAMAFAATGLSIWLVGFSPAQTSAHELLLHSLMAAYLGISLLFGLSMFLERTRLPPIARIPVFLATLASLVGYAISMQGQPDYLVAARFALFILASHLFAAVAPFLHAGHPRGFWEYNHRLFLRILVSILFSACLYLGLVMALAAVEYLFRGSVPGKAHFWLWAAVSGVFNTWFFLAGLPDDFQELEHDHRYPTVLKVLTQYILVPLVSLYMIILYAYMLKILVTWTWPTGWVTYMILICALLGILCLLLTHPIREREENKWIKAFSRAFTYALFPLLLLLFAAIGKRISEYHITENRYFVVVMACWLTGIALYFTFSRVRNIKIVPVSLGLLALLTAFGPWGAFQVSTHSQIRRLEAILVSRQLLQDGKLTPAPAPIDGKTEGRIGSIVDYLQRKKELGRLRRWLPDPALAERTSVLEDPNLFVKQMGLRYLPDNHFGYMHPRAFQSYQTRNGGIRRISGFDFFLEEFESTTASQHALVVPDPNRCELEFLAEKGLFRFTANRRLLMEIKLGPLIESLKQTYHKNWNSDIPADQMYLEKRSGGYAVGLQLKSLSVQESDSVPIVLTTAVYVKLPANR